MSALTQRRAFLGLLAAVPAIAVTRAESIEWPAARRRTGKHSDRFPNLALRTHDDVPVRLYDDLVKDRVVLVNFMYTQCTERCPVVGTNLREVHRRLGARMGRDVHMLSISLTPEIDTPKVLREYAGHFGGPLPGWTFVTGKGAGIETLRRAMGVFDPDPARDADKTIHAGLVTFGNDRSDQWRALPALLEPRDLVAAIVRVARG
jgi:protein SCO1